MRCKAWCMDHLQFPHPHPDLSTKSNGLNPFTGGSEGEQRDPNRTRTPRLAGPKDGRNGDVCARHCTGTGSSGTPCHRLTAPWQKHTPGSHRSIG